MLTYQLQNRRLAIKNGTTLTFPNNVQIDILLEPKEQFGVQSDPPRKSKTVKVKSHVSAFWDANTGKWGGISSPPLNPLNVSFNIENDNITIKGNKIEISFECQSANDFDSTINSLYFFLPAVMNIFYREPPTIVNITGNIGKSLFQLELSSSCCHYDATDESLQEKRMVESFKLMYLLNDPFNIRLTASLYYYYTARRLIDAGISPYEFLAEAILNYSKAIQVLFGESRDEVRTELKKLGVGKEDIEELYIPIMILRNELDVGHVSLKLFQREELDLMYYYLDNLEINMQKLFEQIVNAIKSKNYHLKDTSTHGEEDKVMDGLIDSWTKLKMRKKYSKKC